MEERPPDKMPPKERGPEVVQGADGPPAQSPQKRSFLVDLMLLRLGRWLRLLGQDVANPETDSDGAHLEQAKREKRIENKLYFQQELFSAQFHYGLITNFVIIITVMALVAEA